MRLHKYQEYAVNYILEHKECALILDMGLGKTVITLTALKSLILDSFEVRKALVVAPLRVARDTWPDEIQKWEHLSMLKYSVAIGDEDTRINAIKQNAQITIINRENIPWLIQNTEFDYDMVVIDELSSFKNAKSKRFKALLAVRPRCERNLGLTGTPSPNGLQDLWAEFRLLDLGKRLGRFISHFRETYLIPDKCNGHIVYSYKLKKGAENEVAKKIDDMTLSMKAINYLDMPKLLTLATEVDMTEEEYSQYTELRRNLVLGTEITASNAASLSGKLAQLANGAIYDDNGKAHAFHQHKLDALADLIESANGRPVLVAYWFKHDLERIKGFFNVREIKQHEDVVAWNNGDIPIAVIHPASAGHGLNLQNGGNILIWFGLTWSLELYQQTNARLWRQGQTSKTVVIQHIVTKGTIDYQILKALRNKNLSQDALIQSVKACI